ncbi:hypothetical protein VMCG_08230 [Cytospora schulzeri]|uniref:Terpene synthase n=1 Tax=Cytospora schulzeri TaxID=448051 RepID=A0A423VSV0_9PEZI|nr:hypothetical protein VMCG_08230 [Valsa malicola]
MSQIVHLPDLQGNWKWPRRINPHTEEIRQESLDWAASFGAFSPRAQVAFDKCNFKQLRCSNDLMNLFFIVDEYSDKSSPSDVWDQVSISMDALRNPQKPRPEGEWVGGEATRQFWARTYPISTSTFHRRFIDSWEDYLHGVAQQAEDRHASYVRDVDSYLQVRRKTVGVIPSLNMLEMGMDIPDEVMEHPVIRELMSLGSDLVFISNDILSYNKEQASGDDQRNIVTIVMREQALGVQQAIDWAGQLHDSKTERFNELYLQIPRWGGPLDWEVQTFMHGVAQLVSGNVQWSYESERYLGKRGLEVRATGVLHLSPKYSMDEIGPVIMDETILG